jgi:hypothetical protein
MKKYISIIVLAILVTGFGSCKKYLDKKPDPTVNIPQTLQDCQALLDNYSVVNQLYPTDAELAADNYYLTDVNFNASTNPDAKNNYIWDPQGFHNNQWSGPYTIIYYANLVLETVDKLPDTGTDYKRIKGSALFFRAYAFYHLAQLFANAYSPATAGSDPGIPLRLSPDIDLKYGRGTVQQTYDRIVKDLTDAVDLLPVTTTIQSQPNKVAAYAALSRTYLTMQDYVNAGQMADKALQLYSSLMDFNSVSTIPRFNTEVIFASVGQFNGAGTFFSATTAKIDSALYNSYDSHDKRKTVFYKANTGTNAGTYAFKGSYDGLGSTIIFTGLATDELYLTRAEAYARAGNASSAMADLNTLLRRRYDATFVNQSATTADDALLKILKERRKELVFRNARWTDLRRLNQDPRFPVILRRPMNTISYAPLTPGDLRYTMLIPLSEISLSPIQQNPR